MLYTVFPPLKPEGLIFFYFRIGSFITKQGLIRIITIFANSCAMCKSLGIISDALRAYNPYKYKDFG